MSQLFDAKRAIFWGAFIRAAYAMYTPGVPNPQPPSDFPSGWALVKNITAVSGIGPVRQTEFIGFVARSLNHPNEYAVLLHGTEGMDDFLDDFEFLMTDFTMIPNGGNTEYGFTRFYESFVFEDPTTGAKESLDAHLAGLNPHMSFTVAGFSLGGALATLHAAVLASRGISVVAYPFASPMVGDTTFAAAYDALVPNSFRIVNKPDIVPKVPGTLLGYRHVNHLFEINSLEYPEIKHSIRCFHDVNTYLYALGDRTVDISSCKA